MTFSVLGTDTDGNTVTIDQSSRREGLYIIGATGTGKSTLIENLILQDIAQGLGVCLLDPHGDVVNRVIERLPTRLDDVILLNLADQDSCFGLNLLDCANPQDTLAVQYTVNQVMHVFDRLFDINRGTPLLSYYMRNCAHTIIANPGYTLADIPLLLSDEQCRRKLVAHVTDTNVLLFWTHFDQLRPLDRRREVSAILNKIGQFLQPLLENIVGQATSTLDFTQIMEERKILLVRLDRRLDNMTTLIGSIIIAQILNAAYSRASVPLNKRKQFNLYVDEFQCFATEDFATLLTETRKFGIATTVAHQRRDQLDTLHKGATLTAENLVTFRVNELDAEKLAEQFTSISSTEEETYDDKVHQIANDLVGLAHLTARIRLKEQSSEHITIIKSEQGLPLIALRERIERIKAQNRKERYTRKREDVEEEIRTRQETCTKPTNHSQG